MTVPVRQSNALVIIDQPREDEAARRRRKAQLLAEKSSGLLNRVVAGLLLVVLLVAGAGGWSATAELAGAVIAGGQLVVDSSVKRVQHPTGGIVGEIRVKNGDRVAAGDVLITLDETQTQAQLSILENKLLQLHSEKARFEAERDGKAALDAPEEVDADDPAVRAALEGEQRLFKARANGWRSQKARLGERIGQTRKEVEAIHAQRKAKERELALIGKELRMVEDLHKKNLANSVRLIGMQREVARYEGEHGALMAQIARAESQIKEIELQIVELDQRILTEAQKEIRSIESQIAEFKERSLAARDQVRRTELRAPTDGIVHELSAQTLGGVIRAGETVLLIVPSGDALSAEVRVAPSDIDQVSVGQRARVRLSALNQRKTPELVGRISHVGADLTREPATGQEYFVARIGLEAGEAEKIKSVKLVAGMPVESFIVTEERTALSYLLKPISDQIERAFREE